LEIIKEYQRKDERIVLVDLKQNVGLGFARNEGMKVAKGKYITFVDSDDWITEDYVEVLYKTIEKYKYDVISPDFYEYDDIKQKIFKSKHPKDFYNINISTIDIKQKLLCCEHIHYARKIYKLQFLNDNDITFKINKFEDTLFVWEIILKTNKFMFINNKIYYYRVNRKGSIMTNQHSEFLNNMNLFYALKDLIYNDDNNKKYFDSVLDFFIMNRFLDFAWRNSKFFNSLYTKFKEQYLNDKKIEFYYPNTLKNFIKVKIFQYVLRFNINIVTISFFITYYKKTKKILKSLIGR